MKDRVPTYPGRVTLTPVAGQANTYDMARADEPTEAGTPLNTNTLLAAATAAGIFGDAADHTVSEALSALLGIANSKARVEIISYVGTGTMGQANPTSATFSFEPKLVWIANGEQGGNLDLIETWGYAKFYVHAEQVMLMRGATSAAFYSNEFGGSTGSRSDCTITVSWSGNTVSYYKSSATKAGQQLNQSGKTYYALAIG